MIPVQPCWHLFRCWLGSLGVVSVCWGLVVKFFGIDCCMGELWSYELYIDGFICKHTLLYALRNHGTCLLSLVGVCVSSECVCMHERDRGGI